jgi:hypothetical protein
MVIAVTQNAVTLAEIGPELCRFYHLFRSSHLRSEADSPAWLGAMWCRCVLSDFFSSLACDILDCTRSESDHHARADAILATNGSYEDKRCKFPQSLSQKAREEKR